MNQGLQKRLLWLFFMGLALLSAGFSLCIINDPRHPASTECGSPTLYEPCGYCKYIDHFSWSDGGELMERINLYYVFSYSDNSRIGQSLSREDYFNTDLPACAWNESEVEEYRSQRLDILAKLEEQRRLQEEYYQQMEQDM
jgi:hypothetical protein